MRWEDVKKKVVEIKKGLEPQREAHSTRAERIKAYEKRITKKGVGN